MKNHKSKTKSGRATQLAGRGLLRSALGLRPPTLWSFAFLVLNLAVVSSAFGQGAQAKQRAKELVNQNNVRQGVPPPAPAPPSPAAPGTPGNPAAPNAAVLQAQNISKIKTDLAAFKPGSAVTPEQKQQLIKDLAVACRTAKPSLPAVTKFVNTLAAALSENNLGDPDQERLAINLNTVCNSKPLPGSQFDALIADVQAILQVGGAKRSVATSIAADLKAVGAEVRR